MKKVYTKLFVSLLATSLAFSCGKDDAQNVIPSPGTEQVARGSVVKLDLNGQLEGLRALTYDVASQTNAMPKVKPLVAGATVPVTCIFRKVGDAASTTVVTLDWTVSDDAKTLQYLGDVTLNSGNLNMSENGQWYMMAVIGGTVQGNKVTFDGSRLASANGNDLDFDMPYLMTWRKVDITKSNGFGEVKANQAGAAALFKLVGAVVRYNVYNATGAFYTLNNIRVESNRMTGRGEFDFSNISDSDVTSASEPTFVVPANNERGLIETSYNLPVAESFAALATSKAYYAWAVPVTTTDAARTNVYVDNDLTYESYVEPQRKGYYRLQAEARARTHYYLVGSVFDANYVWANDYRGYPMFADNNAGRVFTYTGKFKAVNNIGAEGFKVLASSSFASWTGDLYGDNGSHDGKLRMATGGTQNFGTGMREGYYTVTIDFNDNSYRIDNRPDLHSGNAATSVVLEGPATQSPVTFVQKSYDPHIWEAKAVNLTAAGLRFKVDNNVWTGGQFPVGQTVYGSSQDITVNVNAEYDIYFNDLTGHYFFNLRKRN